MLATPPAPTIPILCGIPDLSFLDPVCAVKNPWRASAAKRTGGSPGEFEPPVPLDR
jgi:hypothetical protein